MNHTEQRQIGVPFVVRIRAYRSHALTVLVVVAAYLLILSFIAGGAVSAAAELRRAWNAPHNEIVLANEQNGNPEKGEECFIYLKNYAISGEKRKNAVSDLLMVMPETEYENNNVSFIGTLAPGTCAVSANVAAKYGLRVGDTARVIGTEKTFEVVRILPAQGGLDAEYKHEGIVVLSYDKDLLNREYQYYAFMTGGDAYLSLDTLTFVEDMEKDSRKAIVFSALVALFGIAAAMAVSERFLFRARREDYKTLSWLGVRAFRLFMRIWGECALRYALPAVFAVECFAALYASYGSAFHVPAVCFVGTCVLVSLIYSLIVIRRLYHVK